MRSALAKSHVLSRANNARSKAHSAEIYAKQARADSIEGRVSAHLAAPDFRQPGNECEALMNSFLPRPLLGEEKPQPFISLDIDKHVEGKVVSSNHITGGAPNGRLPPSSNYSAHGLLPSPSYLSSAQPNTHSSATGLLLDGGVYQGQAPSTLPPSSSSTATTTNQANDWNSNQKVSWLTSRVLYIAILLSRWSAVHRCPRIKQIKITIRMWITLKNRCHLCPTKIWPILVQVTIDVWSSTRTLPSWSRKEGGRLHFTVLFSFVRLGMPLSKQYPPGMQPMSSGDSSNARNLIYDDNRAAMMATNYSAAPSSPPQFVANPAGMGPRSVPKRSTFIRTRHFDTSNDDLLHDQHQQDPNHPASSNLSAPHSRTKTSSSTSGNDSHGRARLVHGAPNSRNSSGYDSGLSSGGASFDPDQHPIYTLGNPAHPNRSATPTIDVYDVPQPIPIPKRKSLPSIVKAPPNDYKIDETARSSDHLPANETFIIENGIRKRVTAQPPTYTDSGSLIPQASVMTSSSGSPILARRILLESVTRLDQPNSSASATTGGNKRVSMPTLVNIARHRQEAPSESRFHATAHQLSLNERCLLV